MFKLIVITPPEDVPGEKEVLRSLLKTGLCGLHIRKPGKSAGELSAYLSFFEEAERKQMRVHHHVNIARQLRTGGAHISFEELAGGTLPDMPLSVSVHSWEEYEALPEDVAEYAFISPVFDSISKPGYKGNTQLLKPPPHHSVRLIALGGIHGRNIRRVCEAGYEGAAILGAVWQNSNRAVETLRVISEKCKVFRNMQYARFNAAL